MRFIPDDSCLRDKNKLMSHFVESQRFNDMDRECPNGSYILGMTLGSAGGFYLRIL
jgi:hypothetical protein